MTNAKDIVDILDFIGLCSCQECGGNDTEYELIQEAIKEIKNLRLVANAMKTDNAKLRKEIGRLTSGFTLAIEPVIMEDGK
jgi:hypothetical protein